MNTRVLFKYLVIIFCITSLITAGYVLYSSKETSFIILKISFVYVLSILIFLFWGISKIHNEVFSTASHLLARYDSLEKLLLDFRDGTKTFYKEKRKFPRLRCDTTARIMNKDSGELIKVSDISYQGALFKTAQRLQQGEVINLSIYLPLFPQPISVKARVARAVAVNPEGQASIFSVGTEFLQMNRLDREKLIETLNVLHKHS